MKFVVEIEKLKNSTLKQVARDLGWNERENLYDWLEKNTKRFDCDITDDGDLTLEECICDLLNTYKGERDIIETVNKLPDDVFEDKEDLIREACAVRRYKLAGNIWQKIKNILKNFNDISSYKNSREYEVYEREWDMGNRIEREDVVCTIDNEGNVLVEVMER